MVDTVGEREEEFPFEWEERPDGTLFIVVTGDNPSKEEGGPQEIYRGVPGIEPSSLLFSP